MRKKSATRVALVASPGVPLFEFAIATEIFGIDRCDLTADWYDFAVVGIDAPVTEIGWGVTIPAGGGLDGLRDADTVIIPACADISTNVPAALQEALRQAHARGARIAAICSGAFVLAEAGLLHGRRATTHWMHAAELARRYPTVEVDPNVLYVHDEVWTSAGSAAGLDMCLELVRQDHGAAVANEVARRVVTPPHRAGGQAQYIRSERRSHPTQDGHNLHEWVRRNIADVTVTGMADYAGVSQRTLNRRFYARTNTSPQGWLQRTRLETAAELIESTDFTVATIAQRVGLGSAANLRAQFSSAYGIPPAEYRRTFATTPATAR